MIRRQGIIGGVAILGALALFPTVQHAQVTSPPQNRASQAAANGSNSAVRMVVVATESKARYRIQERLAGRDVGNEAIGETSRISGTVVLGADGNVIPSQSRITIDMASLTSDSNRRDNHVRSRVLEADKYPTATMVPRAVRGLPTSPLPQSGTHTFQILGDLTIRGVTRPTTWNVTAQFQDGRMSGNAYTVFTFADFQIDKPRAAIVLTVADDIRLEYDFTFAY